MTQTWRVLIQFQQTKVTYMVHVPSEVQQRGYHKDKLYTGDYYKRELHQLSMLTDAATADEAQSKAKQLLLEYVQVSA